MNFFKKIFNTSKESKKPKINEDEMPLEELFAHKFTEKGGKLLYCTTKDEVIRNILLIVSEAPYKKLLCYNHSLVNLIKTFRIDLDMDFSPDLPFFTACEHLIGREGDVFFTSNQLKGYKLVSYSDYFIVFAKTSQIVNTTNEAMRYINAKYKGKIPSNISSVRYYNLKEFEESFMNYGNTNTKNLYLILFDDLYE